MSSERYDFLEAIRLVGSELYLKRASRVLGGAVVMAAAGEPTMQYLDTGGVARNVTLPLESSNDGKVFIITNTSAGAFALTFLGSAGGALSPAVSAAQGKAVVLYCDGTAWRALVGA
jgi:hypothetical protein